MRRARNGLCFLPIPVALALTVALFGAPVRALELQEIVERVKPSVVHLSVLDDDGERLGTGSGFVVSADGRVATNLHVVEGARRMEATLDEGKVVDVLGAWAFDADADIAVLQLAPGSYIPLSISDHEPVTGEPVIVIGSPRGLAGTVSTGIVSAIREKGLQKDGTEGYASWNIQISAPISPGSSGSPVLDRAGQVLGVAVGMKTSGQALNFAVPAAKLRDLLARSSARSDLIALRDVRTGRSVTTNLMLSAAFLVGIALLWWLGARLARRRVQQQAVRVGSVH